MKYKISKEEFGKLSEELQKQYKVAGGEYTLDVEGVFTPEDQAALKESLRKEREDHSATKDSLKTATTERDAAADKVKVYESDDSKKLDAEQLVEFQRLTRENETLTAENGTLKADYTGLQTEVTTNNIKAHLREAGKGIIREDALDNEIEVIAKDFVSVDGKFLTNSELGAKSGLEAKAYLTQHVEGRSYLAPTSSGGGAGGGGGSREGDATDVKSDGDISIFQTLD